MPTTHSTREDRLSIRTSPLQKDLLVQAAHARHMNMSQFVLQTALDAAQRVLDEERRLTVSVAEYTWLADVMDGAPAAAPRLQAALQKKAVWDE